MHNMTYENYLDNIQKLIDEKYPRIAQLTEAKRTELIEQLWWVQQNPEHTEQSANEYIPYGKWLKDLHREIPRAFCRIDMLLLLKSQSDQNTESLYAEFIKEQPEADRLTKDSFQTLCSMIKNLSDDAIDAQTRASILASITLSPEAKKLADEKLGKSQWPYDSVQFSGRTVSRTDMYPIINSAKPDVKRLVQFCFPDDARHWRHAFFLENSSCLSALKAQILATPDDKQDILKESVQTWLDYWLINTIGFAGHTENMTGSRFMTESVFQRLQLLNASILKLIEDPENIDVFKEYATSCLQFLNVNIINQNLALFILRIANMGNVFNQQAAEEIKGIIDQKQLILLVDTHAEVFVQGKIATYVPGVLQNVYAESVPEDRMLVLIKALDWISITSNQSTAPITSFRTVDASMRKTLLENGFDCDVVINGENGEISSVSARAEKAEQRPSLSPA